MDIIVVSSIVHFVTRVPINPIGRSASRWWQALFFVPKRSTSLMRSLASSHYINTAGLPALQNKLEVQQFVN